MAGKLNRFQTLAFQGWAKDIDKQNNLGRYMQLAPQKASPIIVELLAANTGKNLDIFLSQFAVKEFESDQDYTWDVLGSTRRNIPLKYAVDEAGNVVTAASGLIGKDKQLFELVFAEEWFFDGELLYGELNEAYPLRVMGPVTRKNTEYVYTVQLFGTNTDGMPAEQLLAGKRFSYGHAPVSRGLSRNVGGLRHATPAAMRNEFSQIRLSHKMSGDLMDQKIAMVVPIVDSEGKKVTNSTMWMHLENWEFEKTWSEYKSDVIAYSRSNRDDNGEYMDFDKSGEVIREGDGIYAQTEVANVRYYNRFTLPLIEDILYNLTESKYGTAKRTFILKTGQQGAIKFHKAVKEETSGWFNMQVDAAEIGAVKKTSSALHDNALAAGFQFTEWLAPNGLAVKVEVDNSYDDRVRNKILLDGKPAQSSRFDIWDMGTSQDANICKAVAKNRPETTSYQWGLRDPWTGRYGNEFASHDEDSATIMRMGTFGAIVFDPTRTMSLIPSVLNY